MRFFRRCLLLLIALIPLLTLVHPNDLGRWETQNSAMAGPDEFSYLLMADHFLQGGGLSLKESLGRDTFYPPGYPLLLAAWAKIFGLTAFTAHALNATLLCFDTFLAYILARRLLIFATQSTHRRFTLHPEAPHWLALIVAGIFATNWHVLECSLLIMSEPAFMLVSFAWLVLILRWPRWNEVPEQGLVIGLLATLAWSVRGAGIVCVAATIAYPVITFLLRRPIDDKLRIAERVGTFAIILFLAIAYQATLAVLSPEKSVASGQDSANSYPRQLLHGLTNGQRLHFSNPADYPGLLANLSRLILGHFCDYAASFVPWPREEPDMFFRNLLGKIFGTLGLLGWFWQTFKSWRHPVTSRELAALRMLTLYVLFYVGLYLIWPFNFARFWSPILPLMLAFAIVALIQFTEPCRWLRGHTVLKAAVPLTLLLVLSAEEDLVQLNNYARRLNYVSFSLEQSARIIMKQSPDPSHTIVGVLGGDEHFAFAWYFRQQGPRGRQYLIRSPEPHLASKGGKAETVEEMLIRSLNEPTGSGPKRVFLVSYFTHTDARAILENLLSKPDDPKTTIVGTLIFQKEIIAGVWEVSRIPPKPVSALQTPINKDDTTQPATSHPR